MSKNQAELAAQAIEKAVELAGGQAGLARLCGVKQQMVYNWLHRNRKVSATYAPIVAAALDNSVTLEELRPDIHAIILQNQKNRRKRKTN